ncbi:unnamed protein product [Rotaria sp. Silwood2]|nr:unnamed protein product [Rotaria sp. Silwood2]CAF3882501.1 unnamed protein product [Rotaria sp. Silwood2]
MDRLLTHIRSRALLFISPNRQVSSYKTNVFDLKSRALLNLVNQLDASKQTSPIPSSDVGTPYDLNTRFPLPGRIGFSYETKSISKSFQEKDSVEQLINTHMSLSSTSTNNEKEFLTKLMNYKNLEIRTYDCSSSLCSKLNSLFLNYDILTQPLTAITIVFKTNSDMSTWSIEVENERNQLIEKFNKLAQEISTYLNSKQYWVDFIDPSNGKPYYGPSTSDALFETDERFRNFGINIVDLGCCRVIQHLQHGTHVFVGCIFTSASKMDPHVQNLLKEFDAKYDDICAIIKAVAHGSLKGILVYTDDEVISTDFIGDTHSSILYAKVDISLKDNFVKRISCYVSIYLIVFCMKYNYFYFQKGIFGSGDEARMIPGQIFSALRYLYRNYEFYLPRVYIE